MHIADTLNCRCSEYGLWQIGQLAAPLQHLQAVLYNVLWIETSVNEMSVDLQTEPKQSTCFCKCCLGDSAASPLSRQVLLTLDLKDAEAMSDKVAKLHADNTIEALCWGQYAHLLLINDAVQHTLKPARYINTSFAQVPLLAT